MRRPIVLSLLLQLVFPGETFGSLDLATKNRNNSLLHYLWRSQSFKSDLSSTTNCDENNISYFVSLTIPKARVKHEVLFKVVLSKVGHLAHVH